MSERGSERHALLKREIGSHPNPSWATNQNPVSCRGRHGMGLKAAEIPAGLPSESQAESSRAVFGFLLSQKAGHYVLSCIQASSALRRNLAYDMRGALRTLVKTYGCI